MDIHPTEAQSSRQRVPMLRRVGDQAVSHRIPKGCQLPARFDAFVRANPPGRIEWNDMDRYGLKRSARSQAVPFLGLPDGGVVAFWYHAPSPAIVHLGSEGELKVLALNFDDFLRGLAARCSGLPEFDEASTAFQMPGLQGKPARKGLPALQKEFDEWFQKHTSLQKPLSMSDTEPLRKRVHRIANRMIREGCSKGQTLSSPWWAMYYRIVRTGAGLSITYLDFGKWYALPKKYKLAPEVTELLKLVKHKNRRHYDLSVICVGIVSIDEDRELVLVPPETEGAGER